jgi:hypothetical protein
MASLVLGAVGFVVGGAIGGPWGARIGYAVGTAVGASLSAPKTNVSGPRLNDLRVQSSAWGERIPIVYGSYRVSGNVIWSAGIREVVSRTRNRGKGGGSQTTTTYTYFADFAVAICEGPIIGIKRIWANGKLIYNADDNSDPATLIESNQLSGLFTLYTGTETQTPSSIIEANKGAGNVPAYRGLAYIVFANLPLANYGNALPNLEFEVVTSGVISQSVWASYALAFPPGGRTARLASDGSRLVMYGTESAVSSQNVSYYSDDRGLTWTQGSMQVTPAFGVVQAGEELAYGDGVWLIGQSNGSGHYHRSTNGGASWTRLAYTSTFAGGSVAFGNGIWVSVWGDWALRSTNGGVTWTQHSRPSTGNPTHTIWAGDRFVTLNSGTTVQWSIDGTSWTNTTTNTGAKRAASNGAGVIVAVYTAVSSQFYTLSTDNGQTWSMVQFPGAAQTYVDVAWGGDRFVVIAGGSGNTTSYYSLNGIDGWTAVTQAITRSSARLAYAFPYFVSLHSVSASQDAQRYANYNVLSANTIPVASIVADQFARSGLTGSQYNTAGLTDSVTGYLVPRVSSARDNIEPLQQAFFFDVVESGAELKLVKRGGSIAATIPDDDLGAHAFGADAPASVSIQRTQEVDLPSRVSVRYTNASGDYLPAVEASRRIVGNSRQEEVLELPIALTPNQAATIAEITMYNQYIARTRYTFATSIKYAKYEPTDVLNLPLEFGAARARVIRKEESGPQINWEAVGDDALVYQSTAVGGTQQASQTQIILPSLTRTDWLDIPIVRDQDNDAGAYIVLTPESSASLWRGAELFVSPDDAEFEQIGQVFQVAARGQCSTTLGDFTGGNINDESNTLTVVLTSGTLDTVTTTQWLNGALACLVGNEIVFARVATLTAANTYTLSGLLRGRFGTEQHIGTHVAGERFVRLSTAGTLRPALAESDIGVPYFYRAISVGRRFDSDASDTYTSTAVGLRPYAVAGVRGGKKHNNHFHVEWFRRSRVDGGWRSNVDVPLTEAAESYEVDILNGSVVVRTFRVSEPVVDYTSSQQNADFGTTQASISIVIYQMSSAVGRGFPRAATIS